MDHIVGTHWYVSKRKTLFNNNHNNHYGRFNTTSTLTFIKNVTKRKKQESNTINMRNDSSHINNITPPNKVIYDTYKI